MNPADTTQARRFFRALATTRPEDGSIAADALIALQVNEELARESELSARRAEAAGRKDLAEHYRLQGAAYFGSACLLAQILGLSRSIYEKPLSDSSTVRTASASQPATDN